MDNAVALTALQAVRQGDATSGDDFANMFAFFDVATCEDLQIDLRHEASIERAAASSIPSTTCLTPAKKRALIPTLASWARQPAGGVPVIARDLDVHPQTVRYRMKILRSLYGDKLDDQRLMFMFSIALRYTADNLARSPRPSVANERP